jgi:hypothetical protein
MLLFDRNSTTVVVLFGSDVCGVMCGVVSVLSLIFRSSVCCLWGDLGLVGFDRAMFGDFLKKMVFASFGGSVWSRNLC